MRYTRKKRPTIRRRRRQLGGKTRNKQGTDVTKMNCNPVADKAKIANDTCFTKHVLQSVKQSYNKAHPTSQIQTDDPNQILSEIKTKMPQCKREDCFLDVIKDPTIRKKLDKQLFAPDHPAEWNKDSDAWLSNFDINSVLNQYEESHPNFEFIESTPIDFDHKISNDKCVRDDLCKFSLKDHIDKNKTKIAIVFNLGKHDESGSHWVSMFIDVDYSLIFYFDSASNPTPKEITTLKDRIIKQGLELDKPISFKYHTNGSFTHQKSNTECGMYSLYFIITMITHTDMHGRKLNVKQLLDLFKRVRIPDEEVFKFRKKYFNTPDK